MSLQLQYSTEFQAVTYIDDQLKIHNFLVNVGLLVQTPDADVVTVAMQRMQTFLDIQLPNTVFIDQDLGEQIQLMQHLNFDIVSFPGDPVNQLVGIMLYCKLNAIFEGHVEVSEVSVCNSNKTQLWFVHQADDPIGPFEQNGWWHSNSTRHNDSDLPGDTNVTNLPVSGWGEYFLDWPDASSESEPSGQVLPFVRYDS